MKGEAQIVDKPISKPTYPLPTIFGKSGRNKGSIRVEWDKTNRGRQPEHRTATARSKENQ